MVCAPGCAFGFGVETCSSYPPENLLCACVGTIIISGAGLWTVFIDVLFFMAIKKFLRESFGRIVSPLRHRCSLVSEMFLCHLNKAHLFTKN